MDATGRIVEFNAAAERVFGYIREQDAIGQELASLIIPPGLAGASSRRTAALPRDRARALCSASGSRSPRSAPTAPRFSSSWPSPLCAPENEPVFTAYLRDITDRNRGEEASRRLAAIIESSDDAIVSKDLDGIITSWNAAAERLFGYKPEEIVGKSILTLIPPDRQHEEPGILERIRRGATHRSLRDRSPPQRWHLVRYLGHGLAAQRPERPNHRRLENRARHHRPHPERTPAHRPIHSGEPARRLLVHRGGRPAYPGAHRRGRRLGGRVHLAARI